MTATLSWALNRVRAQTLLMVHDLEEEQWCRQDLPGEHHPAWILGHLLLADSYLLHMLEVEELPEDFDELLRAHGPDSAPTTDSSAYQQPHRVLATRLDRVGRLRVERVSGMTAQDLKQPLPDSNLATTQPTVGHHLQALVFHEGYHGGRLAAWRHRRGRQAVSWILSPGP